MSIFKEKKTWLFSILVIAIFLLLTAVYSNKFLYRSKADINTSSVAVSIKRINENEVLTLGKEFTVKIIMETLSSVSGADLTLIYDPAKFEVVADYTEPTDCGQLNYPVLFKNNEEEGILRVAKVNKGSASALPRDAFCFAAVRFRTVGYGSTQIKVKASGNQVVGINKDNNQSGELTLNLTSSTLDLSLKRQDEKTPFGAYKIQILTPQDEEKVSLYNKEYAITYNVLFTPNSKAQINPDTLDSIRFRTEIYLYRIDDNDSLTPTLALPGQSALTPEPLITGPEPGLDLVAIITRKKRSKIGENVRLWNVRKIKDIGKGYYNLTIRIFNPEDQSDELAKIQVPINLATYIY